jgi:hypothetical protein
MISERLKKILQGEVEKSPLSIEEIYELLGKKTTMYFVLLSLQNKKIRKKHIPKILDLSRTQTWRLLKKLIICELIRFEKINKTSKKLEKLVFLRRIRTPKKGNFSVL